MVSVASSLVSTASTAAAQPSVFANWLKIIGLRAAGLEGPAENLKGPPPSSTAISESVREKVYETQWRTTPCVTNAGQAFAIWLNLAYFLPLLVLFIRFFITAYTRRGNKYPNKKLKIEQSAKDALNGVKRKVSEEESSKLRLGDDRGKSNGASKE